MLQTKYVIAVAALYTFGCAGQENVGKGGRPDKRDENERVKEIHVGMDEDQLLSLAQDFRLSIEDVGFGAVRTVDSDADKLYIIRPKYASDDALVMQFHRSSRSDAFVMQRMYWHLGYGTDAELPKVKRTSRFLDLQNVEVSVLLPSASDSQLPNSPESNPFE